MTETSAMAAQQLEELIGQYSALLYRHCYVLLGHQQDAQDAVQEVFLRYWRYQPDLHDQEHTKAWLLKVATNLCHNHHRNKNRHPQVPLDTLPEQADTSDTPDLTEALVQLPAPYKRVVLLHYIHGYKVREIAAMERLTPSAVKMRLQKSRQLLQALCKEDLL